MAVGVGLMAFLAACSPSPDVAVDTADVTSATVVQTVAAPATVEPSQRRTVTSPTAGEVAERLVQDGATVAAGDPVLRLRSDSADLALVQARAGLDAAGALADLSPAPDLSTLLAPLRQQVDAVVPGILDTLEHEAASITDDQVRQHLVQRLTETRAAYERTARDLARAEADASRAARRATSSQRAVAEAQRQQAEAALAAARAREDALMLVAPVGGVLEYASGPDRGPVAGDLPADVGGLLGSGPAVGPVDVGATVVPGQALFTVYDLSGFHVAATVDEVDAVLVEVDQPATVLVDAYPDDRFEGHVTRVGIGPRRSDSGGVVYPVTVAFRSLPDGIRLRVGMTASVEIEVERVTADTVVPAAALLRRDGRDVVLVVQDEGDGGRVREVAVEVAALGEDTAAVEGDLAPGDVVVLSGSEQLEDGDRLP
ncbi:MAG TPA: HlyD family efflux transporter periplasmic adaptor subunit [Nitriliruptorales bacterium]|nr:HlyD family efflux transporter periplasmic adaptor subunit [Nitriliruptorales bacterium]